MDYLVPAPSSRDHLTRGAQRGAVRARVARRLKSGVASDFATMAGCTRSRCSLHRSRGFRFMRVKNRWSRLCRPRSSHFEESGEKRTMKEEDRQFSRSRRRLIIHSYISSRAGTGSRGSGRLGFPGGGGKARRRFKPATEVHGSIKPHALRKRVI